MIKFRHFFSALLAAAITLTSCGDKSDDPTPKPDPTPDIPVNIFDVPEKTGYNIRGVVYCGKNPVEGVTVSDGYVVAKTDKNGHYYIKSDKRSGAVSVSFPQNYTVDRSGIYPAFYQSFTSQEVSVGEQHDFELKQKPGSDYVIIALADVQIGGLYDAAVQFTNNFLPDIQQTIKEYTSKGKEVYILTLGDQSHDYYWYTHNVDLVKAMNYLTTLNAPVFNIMGNHDNDPYCADDYAAERTWRKNLGPKNYSFNIGEVHYVMLDNIVYENDGASEGTMGDRDYTLQVTADQLNWLKADLASVSKTTPIVVSMHAPCFEKPKMYNDEATPKIRHRSDFVDRDKLVAAFSGYNSVTILTGHTHTNYCNAEGNIREYTVGAVNGSLWRSSGPGYSQNNVCIDGSPAGYMVMEVNGKSMTTRYKSANYPADYQFRAYDVNSSRIVKSKFFPNSSSTNAKAESTFRSTISSGAEDLLDEWFYSEARTDNYVIINVFAWDDRWKISVTENGVKLDVTQINALDPFHLISLGCKMMDNNEKITNGPLPSLSAHFFRVQAKSATSTLSISVTDPYGNTYSEEMTRPKALSLTMK